MKNFLKEHWFKIIIIVGVLVLGGVGYFGVKQYQKYQSKKNEDAKQAQIDLKNQQEALAKAQQEIVALEKNQAKQDISISSSDIESYLTGIQKITCYGSGNNWDMGSGSLWLMNQGYFILTNKHVIAYKKCEMDYNNENNKAIGFYGLDTTQMFSKNQETDSTFVPIKLDPSIDPTFDSASLSLLNYKISALRDCQLKMPVGSPVVLIGYPAYARKTVDVPGGGWVGYKTTTNGIISGYDDVFTGKYGNYFVSAKIDSGNSGGIAFSKDANGLCVLGIPTWLTVGNYETQGIVQNIYNILYQE